jgi:neutral ceramidase
MFGPDVVVVFTAGASGDVTQVDNLSPHAERAPEDGARFVGGRVGSEAVKVLLSAARGEGGPVAVRSRVLRIERRKPSPERVRAAYQTVARKPEEAGFANWIFAKEIVLLDARIAREPVADVEVQAIQVGPAVFVANPAEYFCAYGLEIKKRSPFPFTFPVSNANGYAGYVPTEDAFEAGGGGYETRLTASSNLETRAGTRIAEVSIELCASLKPAAAPELPKAEPFSSESQEWMKGPWRYGSVPPEKN